MTSYSGLNLSSFNLSLIIRLNIMKFFSLKKKKLMIHPLKLKDNLWIQNNRYINSSFEELFENCERVYPGFINRQILFLRANGSWALALNYKTESHIILIFDELAKLLKSGAPRLGQAILAHELGHLYFNHSESNIDPLEAQVEADTFAAKLGYGKELTEVLQDIQDHHDHIEVRVRISYLTSYLFSQYDQ